MIEFFKFLKILISSKYLLNSEIFNKLSSNKLFITLISFIICSLWVFLISNYNFDKGIDFTDSTLTYHYSLRVLNGDLPYKDFHLFVMPLAIYVEAFFHKIFGENFSINSYLALFNAFLQTYLLYLIFFLFSRSFSKSILISLFTISLVGSFQGTLHFSFTPLAITISYATIYFALLSAESKKYLFLTGVLISITFLAKQNFGISLLLGYFLYEFLTYFIFENQIKSTLLNLTIFLLGILAILIPFFIYFNYLGVTSEIIYVLTTGLERKGLNILSVDFINTLIPIFNPKIFFLSLTIGLWTAYIYLNKKIKLIIFNLAVFGIIGILGAFSVGKFQTLSNIIFYDAPKLLLPPCLIYICFFKKSFDKKFILFLILSSALIYVNELSWPGRGFDNFKTLSTMFLFIFPLVFYSIKLNTEYNPLVNATNLITLFVNLLFGVLSILFPIENIRRDFNASTTLTLSPYLLDKKTSFQHKKAIIKSRDLYDKYCSGKKIFVFPWAPILYEFIGGNNVTRFDLPYHDWLTNKEAEEAINHIRTSPPCLLVIDKKSLSESGKKSPFPALPMRKIENFLKNELLEGYTKVEEIETYTDIKLIFKKNK